MIAYLKGKVILARWGFLIVETGGVGYRVSVNPQINIPNNIVDTKEEINLFIHEHIREDANDLYGFLIFQELELFEKLISVNGVGPKVAMNIMNSGESGKIISAITSDDLSFFLAISGIGKKAAAKIILDLKSKLSGDQNINVLSNVDGASDLFDALTTLGYSRIEVSSIATKIPSELKTTEEKVRWCLKNLGK